MDKKLLNWEVKKRTLEGKTDKSKNNNPLTSEYRTGLKYILLYQIQWDHGGVSNMYKCFKTKKEAINYVGCVWIKQHFKLKGG